MTNEQQKISTFLRKLSSEEALVWIKKNYPFSSGQNVGDAIKIIPQRSWKKEQQVELLKTYMPHTFPNCVYSGIRAFNSIMSTKKLTILIWEHFNDDKEKLALLEYFLPFIIRDEVDNNKIKHLSILLEKIKSKEVRS